MKKSVFAIAAIVFALLCQSCNKKYTCTCVISQTHHDGQIVSTEIDGASTKDDAQYKCNEIGTNLEKTQSGVTAECHI